MKLSIVATIALAFCGIGAGLYSGSFAVVFDGIYSLTDAFMTVLALSVARLIAASAQPKPEENWSSGSQWGFGIWNLLF